jgi:hypothetical protein
MGTHRCRDNEADFGTPAGSSVATLSQSYADAEGVMFVVT